MMTQMREVEPGKPIMTETVSESRRPIDTFVPHSLPINDFKHSQTESTYQTTNNRGQQTPTRRPEDDEEEQKQIQMNDLKIPS
jgi:hypothetical protein